MGPAILVKSLAGRRFSLIVFGVSQVCFDIEPLVRMISGDGALHGFTHRLPGAFGIGIVAALLGQPIANWWLGVVRRDLNDRWTLEWLGSGVSWPIAFGSAWIGTGSHLILDGFMHSDMRPFWPLSRVNPILGVMEVDAIYVLCIVSGVVGLGILIALRAVAPKRSNSGAT